MHASKCLTRKQLVMISGMSIAFESYLSLASSILIAIPLHRLDRSCIFTTTSQSAGSTASITGRFCLWIPETVWVKSIKVRGRGLLRIPRDGFMVTEDRQAVTHEKEQALASSKTRSSFQIPAGYYEFLFDVPLSSNIIETVTGPEHNYHTYQVDAIIERRYWRDIVVSQPLSIYRLPDVETSHLTTDFPLTVEGQSDQNIRHCTSIPNSTIPFGSIYPVECGFAVPSKNIKLSTVTLAVTEKHNLRLDATAAQAALCNINSITSSRAHTVFKEMHTLAPESGLVSRAGTEWCISTRGSLPQSLDSCSQSVMTKKIKISHVLAVTAEFQDESGRLLDKIVNTIPFSIYIAPSILGPDGSICSKFIENNISPPPPYSKHMCHVRLLESTEVGRSGQCTIADRTVERTFGDQLHRFQLLEPAPSYGLAVGREPPVYTS